MAMAGSSITAFANDDAPVIKGHEQPRNRCMTDLQAAADTSGLAISFPTKIPALSRSQRSEAASFSVEKQPSTPQRQISVVAARPTNLTDSSDPKSLVDTPIPDRLHDTCQSPRHERVVTRKFHKIEDTDDTEFLDFFLYRFQDGCSQGHGVSQHPRSWLRERTD
ncbi:hypothetical protein NLG97_g6842 [Lecanicillium saksenae]|uniref:Uncharacterized protein n=1 Tax=Lecanicillium saksenae TaxID=468837 RepID=A0ACC1QNH8_9HYPO|nr:hypothetical protein NLG97_g6842 [Lecanicillium saksenae]